MKPRRAAVAGYFEGGLSAAILFSACALSLAADASNEAALPKPVPPARYAALAAVSPFAPPTAAPTAAAPPPPPPQPSWAEAWMLSSVAEVGPGQYRLTLNKRKAGDGKGNDRVVLVSGQENEEHISIAGVQWSDKPEQTRITLNRSGVFAVFTFDPSALAAQSSGGGGMAQGRPPGLPAGMPQPLNRPGMPGGVPQPPTYSPGADANFTPPPPPTMPAPTSRPQSEIPQRAGTRTGPIPGAPAATVPSPRVFRPPGSPGGPPVIQELPGGSNTDKEQEL
jgi:hypothetical protein